MTIQGAQQPGAPLFDDAARRYDALLVLSFGGPEGMEDVLPFLENVTRGRNIPRERLEEVAEHYYHFGGVSPINAQNRALIAALERELAAHGIALPIYFGNRNWRPFLSDTIEEMRADGVREVLVFVTSAYSSYSGCRQYREDVMSALDALDVHDMRFDKIRVFFNHPGFIEPMAERVRDALAALSEERQPNAEVVFTAHSIPLAMAKGSAYERQLREATRLVAERAGAARYRLAWQSRSGPPQVPWLEPDILDVLAELGRSGVKDVVVVPIGFISDHLEVLFDLDVEARELANRLGMGMTRVPSIGVDPAFVTMIRELIEERLTEDPERRALGTLGASHDICPLNCCRLESARRPAASDRERAIA
ncbi:MAG: ferrochelatase [Thermomicrobiales bacterium]|nr:ferrochelatase [Thermomicrobiales bacterium]